MREDMHKVIVERPRSGRWAKRCRNRFACHNDLPTKIGSRRFVQATESHTKEFSENLAPLRRYLAKQVGRPWDKIYSEICANLHPRHTVKQHVLEHLEQFVAYRLSVGRDGEWFDSSPYLRGEAGWYQDLYVDPIDGILKDSGKYWRKRGIDPKPWQRRREAGNETSDVVWLSVERALQCIDGLWFAVAYRQCAGESAHMYVYDVVRKRMVLAGERHAVSKRQLSARELADHGLQNDNQEIDDKVPQRHKRKRKRKRP